MCWPISGKPTSVISGPAWKADIYLLAESGRKIRGIVQGLPKAVSMLASPTKSAAGGEGILSQVSPTLDFILLAQRYPVRIVLDEPEDHSFRMGGTAAVIVRTESDVTSGLKRLSELQQGDTPAFISPLGGASTIPLHE